MVSPASRFLPNDVLDNFDRLAHGDPATGMNGPSGGTTRVGRKSRMLDMSD